MKLFHQSTNPLKANNFSKLLLLFLSVFYISILSSCSEVELEESEYVEEVASVRSDIECRITKWDPVTCELCVTCPTSQRVTFFNFLDPINLSQNFVITPSAGVETCIFVENGKTMGVLEDDYDLLDNQLTFPPDQAVATGFACPI